jgi:hypothetical protein
MVDVVVETYVFVIVDVTIEVEVIVFSSVNVTFLGVSRNIIGYRKNPATAKINNTTTTIPITRELLAPVPISLYFILSLDFPVNGEIYKLYGFFRLCRKRS